MVLSINNFLSVKYIYPTKLISPLLLHLTCNK